MSEVSLSFALGGSLPHVLHRQRRHNHDREVDDSEMIRFDKDASQARVEWESGKFTPQTGESSGLLAGIQRSQLAEFRHTIRNGAGRGRIQERKIRNFTQS
ncbi:Uncharacterised protein [Mobiluncus curtisii]|uniref:Uncharacterized protein n=1 Tax=Mobiluncus curtisii TaxID=2051 RepID=A0A2X3BSQ5_9ACTO|nr:Uncharacterised protein [Mobiluncus curtisii]